MSTPLFIHLADEDASSGDEVVTRLGSFGEEERDRCLDRRISPA